MTCIGSHGIGDARKVESLVKVTNSTRNATVLPSYVGFGHNRQVTEAFLLVCLKGGETPGLIRVKYLTEFGVPIKIEYEYLNL